MCKLTMQGVKIDFRLFTLSSIESYIWKVGMQDVSVRFQWPRINDNTIQRKASQWPSFEEAFCQINDLHFFMKHQHNKQGDDDQYLIYSAKPNFFVPTWSTEQVVKVQVPQAPQTKYQWHKLTQSNWLQFVSRCMSTLIFFSMNQTTDQTHPYLHKSSAFTYRSSPNLHA